MKQGASLAELARAGLGLDVRGEGAVRVRGVHHDSRQVEPGDLFVAVPGQTTHGARFITDAFAKGAVAVAVESWIDLDVAQLRVTDARAAIGALAAYVYGDPTARLAVVGVTGTNGKTTTTWLLDEALAALGARAALLGTIESRGPGVREPVSFTTPEGDAIARFARKCADAGATHLVMEVSSHALAQRRADAVHFDVAAFTNLTQDHLDFHGSIDAYFKAKARLFLELGPRVAVINVDDPYGRKLADKFADRVLAARTTPSRQGGGLIRVSCRKSDGPLADVQVIEHRFGAEGVMAKLDIRGTEHTLTSPLVGAHNLENLALAAGCLLGLGHQGAVIVRALARCRGAPGRLERIDGLDGVSVLVDYAHTPDAVARVIAAVRPITTGRVIVVFGCGGDRDREKRPLMGAAALAADLAVLTSDNPRTEDPRAILADVEVGMKDAPKIASLVDATRGYRVEEDRRTAIALAIDAARPGDTVLIAGKGHEDYQIRGTEKIHFDDREEARAAIARRSSSVGEG